MNIFLKMGLLIVNTLILSASCDNYYILGQDKYFDKDIVSKNIVVWDKKDGVWSVSKPKENLKFDKKICQDSGYLLVNDDSIDYKKPIFKNGFYELKKGWNFVASPKDGIDIYKSFKNVEFVYVYNKESKVWAGYSPNKKIMNTLYTTRILDLKYIEAGIGFFVYIDKPSKVKIYSKQMNKICKEKMQDKNYDYIEDSGIDKTLSYNKDKTIGIGSRYYSHNTRGVYNDTRVVLIYPKLKKLDKTKKLLKYGPVVPKIILNYNKAYEDKIFYVYDYFKESCNEGMMPSKKIPPFPTLKKIKE